MGSVLREHRNRPRVHADEGLDGNRNMNHCPKCGFQLDKLNLTEGWLHCYCKQCHFSHDIPNTKPKENAITYIIIYLVCAGITILIDFIPFARHSNITIIFPIAALVAIVTGFIRHPQSRAIKVLFWITMALIAIAVISIVVAIVTCVHACATFDCSTCPG